jgi:hypothetical protein
MQIREQGQQVQLIRSPYDKTKKRCVQKVVHHFPRQYSYLSADVNQYLSAEQLADLSDDEKEYLSDWLKARADKALADGRRYKISGADKNLSDLADAILSDGVTPEQSAKIAEALAKVSKALKKKAREAARSKPAAPAEPPAADPRQPGLL